MGFREKFHIFWARFYPLKDADCISIFEVSVCFPVFRIEKYRKAFFGSIIFFSIVFLGISRWRSDFRVLIKLCYLLSYRRSALGSPQEFVTGLL